MLASSSRPLSVWLMVLWSFIAHFSIVILFFLNRFVRFPLKECADLFGLPYTGVIDRPDLQETFLEECRKLKHDFIHNGKGVEGYDEVGIGLGDDEEETKSSWLSKKGCEVGGLLKK